MVKKAVKKVISKTMIKEFKPSWPEGVIADDLKWPPFDPKASKAKREANRVIENLMFYETVGYGWVLATLNIGGAGRKMNSTARTYGVRVSDGSLVRVGHGPHVTRTIEVYVTESRRKNLQRYLDMKTKGTGDALKVRDRISSRRAQGALERAEGNRFWNWKV